MNRQLSREAWCHPMRGEFEDERSSSSPEDFKSTWKVLTETKSVMGTPLQIPIRVE